MKSARRIPNQARDSGNLRRHVRRCAERSRLSNATRSAPADPDRASQTDSRRSPATGPRKRRSRPSFLTLLCNKWLLIRGRRKRICLIASLPFWNRRAPAPPALCILKWCWRISTSGAKSCSRSSAVMRGRVRAAGHRRAVCAAHTALWTRLLDHQSPLFSDLLCNLLSTETTDSPHPRWRIPAGRGHARSLIPFALDLARATQLAEDSLGFSPLFGWSHYRVLMKVSGESERRFYELEAEKEGWDVEQFERQIHTLLFARLLKSRDKAGVIELASQGQRIGAPSTHSVTRMYWIS